MKLKWWQWPIAFWCTFPIWAGAIAVGRYAWYFLMK